MQPSGQSKGRWSELDYFQSSCHTIVQIATSGIINYIIRVQYNNCIVVFHCSIMASLCYSLVLTEWEEERNVTSCIVSCGYSMGVQLVAKQCRRKFGSQSEVCPGLGLRWHQCEDKVKPCSHPLGKVCEFCISKYDYSVNSCSTIKQAGVDHSIHTFACSGHRL